MRLILRLVLFLPAIALAAAGLLLVLALDDQPLVTNVAPLSPEELTRAERMLRELDEIAYLRFASEYQAFESLEDFERAINRLREEDAAREA